jgi:hypothetical protein
MVHGRWLRPAVTGALLAALALPAQGFAQIVFSRTTNGDSNLWVMNDNGNNPHSLIADNQYQGITGASQPNLRPGTTDLAFQANGALPAGSVSANGCGINCTGIYTLIGGTIRRISPAVEPCTGSGPGSTCSTEIDNTPTLTGDGRVLYTHTGSLTGTACYGYYCGVYGDEANVDLVQSDLGGDTPTAWPTANVSGEYQPAVDGGHAIADPGADLIAYEGLEDFNCTTPDECTPLTIDDATGKSPYNIAVAQGMGDLTPLAWYPSGGFILSLLTDNFGTGDPRPGLWVWKNTPYTPTGGGSIDETGWWVLNQAADTGGGFPSGELGYDGALETDGTVLFTSGGDIYSLPPSCWDGSSTNSGAAKCTMAQATRLTSSGQDSDPTWTSATTPITVNTAPPPKPATSKLGKVSHSGTTVSAALKCSTGSGHCTDVIGLTTYEILRGSKVIAVAASKTKRKSVILGSKTVTIAAGKSETISVGLGGAGKGLLKRFHKLPLLVVVLQGQKLVGSAKVTLVAPKPKKKKH